MSTQIQRLYRTEEHMTCLLTNNWIPKENRNGVCRQKAPSECVLYTVQVKVCTHACISVITFKCAVICVFLHSACYKNYK
jgi:hypothetical protein